MKLKLEAQDNIKVLTVTEELLTSHAAILKVGLRKMFQTGITQLILDLSQAGPTTPEALKSVAAGARADSASAGIRLMVVSNLMEVADASDVASAVQ
jgi:hypothetical protein